MPVPLHSARSAAVKWLSPAFDVEYGASPGSALVPASDDTFMMWPRPRGAHRREHRPAEQHRRDEVDRDQLADALRVELGERAGEVDARVVDEHVDRTVGLDRAHQRFDRRRVGEVGRVRLAAELGRELRDRVARPGDEHDPRALRARAGSRARRRSRATPPSRPPAIPQDPSPTILARSDAAVDMRTGWYSRPVVHVLAEAREAGSAGEAEVRRGPTRSPCCTATSSGCTAWRSCVFGFVCGEMISAPTRPPPGPLRPGFAEFGDGGVWQHAVESPRLAELRPRRT